MRGIFGYFVRVGWLNMIYDKARRMQRAPSAIGDRGLNAEVDGGWTDGVASPTRPALEARTLELLSLDFPPPNKVRYAYSRAAPQDDSRPLFRPSCPPTGAKPGTATPHEPSHSSTQSQACDSTHLLPQAEADDHTGLGRFTARIRQSGP